MQHRSSVGIRLSLLGLGLLAACAGAGRQLAPMPVLDSAVPADRCRVFVARSDVLAGSIRNVLVMDGDVEIGTISEDEFLCWDRAPVRGVGIVVFQGLGHDETAVENNFDLPREAGSTHWYAIEIVHQGHKPEIREMQPDEGRALIAERRPAATR